jgi:hypothetical protein
MGRGIGPPGGNLLVGHRGSVSGPSPSESKNASASLTRLVLYVSGREAWVFVSFGTQKVISYARNVTPPYGGDLLEVIPRRRRGGFFVITNEPEQPIAKARRPPVGRPERGGGRGETEVNRPAPGGGRRTTTEPQQTASESLGRWDSPPGRWDVYHDLEAEEGQYHV